MKIYKVVINVEGRNIESHVKEGVMASVEVGKIVDGEESPENRINVIVGQDDGKPAAWAQVANFAKAGYRILDEGWIREGENEVKSSISQSSISASIAVVEVSSDEITQCLKEAKFASTKCCTAYGEGGCYIRCCASCCSDPVGCPGAKCCS